MNDRPIFFAVWFLVGILSAILVRCTAGRATRHQKWEWVFYTAVLLFGPIILLVLMVTPQRWIRTFGRGWN